MSGRLKLTLTMQLSPEQIAEAFCDLDDDEQAKVFVEAARIAESWTGPADQWRRVGEHLRTCSCSTDAARAMIRRIVSGMHDIPDNIPDYLSEVRK